MTRHSAPRCITSIGDNLVLVDVPMQYVAMLVVVFALVEALSAFVFRHQVRALSSYRQQFSFQTRSFQPITTEAVPNRRWSVPACSYMYLCLCVSDSPLSLCAFASQLVTAYIQLKNRATSSHLMLVTQRNLRI